MKWRAVCASKMATNAYVTQAHKLTVRLSAKQRLLATTFGYGAE